MSERALPYLVFVTAFALVSMQSKIAAAVRVIVTGVALAVWSGSPYFGLFAVFLLTIVHVLVFTAAFMPARGTQVAEPVWNDFGRRVSHVRACFFVSCRTRRRIIPADSPARATLRFWSPKMKNRAATRFFAH